MDKFLQGKEILSKYNIIKETIDGGDSSEIHIEQAASHIDQERLVALDWGGTVDRKVYTFYGATASQLQGQGVVLSVEESTPESSTVPEEKWGKILADDIVAKGKCKVTGNACGTDTWGPTPCGCEECRRWLARCVLVSFQYHGPGFEQLALQLAKSVLSSG